MMKRRVVGTFLLLMSSALCATWKLGNLINESDLVFESASYIKPKQKQIEHLTDVIAKSNQAQSKTIPINYTVADTSKGHSLIQANNGFRISVDGNATHSYLWERASTKANRKKKAVGKENADPKKRCLAGKMPDPHKFSYTARAFVEQLPSDNQINVVACAAQGYAKEGVVFNIIVSGTAGRYSVQFQPLVVA